MKQLLLTLFFALTLTVSYAQRDANCGNCLGYGGEQAYDDNQNNHQYASAVIKRSMVYPNPATDYIRLKESKGVVEVRIFNLVGRQVESYRITEKDQSFRVADLPDGMYLVQLINAENKIIGTHRMNKR